MSDNYEDALADLRGRGYEPILVCRAPYGQIRTGDHVAALRLFQSAWKTAWIVDEITHVHSFSNMAIDYREVTAWLMTGLGVWCPLVVLARNEHGIGPNTERHMPSPGYGYEYGVAQRTVMWRCADASCNCHQHVNADQAVRFEMRQQ